MTDFANFRRALPPVLCGALLLGGGLAAVFAQDAAPAPPPAPTPTPSAAAATPGKIDPAARAVLEKMVAAHQGLKSYSATLEFTAKQGERTQARRSVIAFQKPGRVRVVTTDTVTGVVTRVISDGADIFLASSAEPKRYRKQKAVAGLANIAASIGVGGGGGTGLLPLLTADPKALDRLVPSQTKSLTLGAGETVAGAPVDVVTAVVGGVGPDSDKAPQPKITVAVGKEDRLLRRVTIDVTGSGGGLALREVFTDVKADPVLETSRFTFTPEPGAEEVKAPEPQAQAEMYDPRLKVGARPIALSGTDLSGKSLSLDQYKGKVVLVDFWATWCGPCVGEMPNVIAAYNKFKGQGFDIVGVSLDQPGDRAKLTEFIAKHRMPWRQIYDGKGWEAALAKAYGVRAIPFTMLVGRDGTIVALNPRGPELEPAIRTALAKK
jgi:outer membrane lipoprotein-sorting protein/peroxiredoxin